MKITLRASRALGLFAAAVGLVGPLAMSTPASAATVNNYVSNNCNTANTADCWNGVSVLYVFYSQVDANGYTGSARSDFYGDVSNYSYDVSTSEGTNTYWNYRFGNGGSGDGQPVRNDAASALACGSTTNYRVYYSTGYQGSSQYISGDWGCNNGVNLESWLRNENASQHWS
ncbi:hypothetical protein E6W39_19705 [Kitasatospora acidiphila]|uniref:Peptidase inhibitor family I36 n=1 Tax=Kitasatospora acidiphila TaxID=2567942 RepID=A0A540W4T9_9ACTN|nr:hypothetical protein [Kitasatospora acidiphila]TQF04049.1 hypothetical protein E6W39_19705 [Kitasatospora acidiphila]